MEKQLILGQGQKMYKMRLGQFQKAPAGQWDELSVDYSNNCNGFKCIKYVSVLWIVMILKKCSTLEDVRVNPFIRKLVNKGK